MEAVVRQNRDPPPTATAATEKSQAKTEKSVKPKEKKKGNCFTCGLRGHYAIDCYRNQGGANKNDKARYPKFKRTEVVEKEESESVEMDFHALQVIPTFQSVKTEAVDECLKTNDLIFAEVTLAGSVKSRME